MKNKDGNVTGNVKSLSTHDINVILAFRLVFDEPFRKVRRYLHVCDDDCPSVQFNTTKIIYNESQGLPNYTLSGHPLSCYAENSNCFSKLRILRAASTHYPLLRNFLKYVYAALESHKVLYCLDTALQNGDLNSLVNLLDILDFKSLISFKEKIMSKDSEDMITEGNNEELGLESEILLKHAKIVSDLEKQISDFAINECCSCECLYQRKAVTRIKLSDNLGGTVWSRLKDHIAASESEQCNMETLLYICYYCKLKIKKDILPPRCILNGLQTIPIPQELISLDPLSSQLIQLAKCYQTIVRLGTYTAKVPIYNSLKACKGTVFFLPLPFEKTLSTIDQINHSDKTILPNPELYIIVNGKPTKDNVMWRTLLNVKNIRAAIKKLKEINWLYKDIENTSVDRVTKEITEVISKISSRMLVRATDRDLSTFQMYTIRILDNRLSDSLDSDIEQYKLLNIQESPLDNRQRYLDVMCFPILFPTGKYGQYHDREIKLSLSKYIKSRLLNSDSRFRKNP